MLPTRHNYTQLTPAPFLCRSQIIIAVFIVYYGHPYRSAPDDPTRMLRQTTVTSFRRIGITLFKFSSFASRLLTSALFSQFWNVSTPLASLEWRCEQNHDGWMLGARRTCLE